MREVCALMENINIRKHNDVVLKAKLAGASGIEFIEKTPKIVDSPDIEDKIARARKKAQQEIINGR